MEWKRNQKVTEVQLLPSDSVASDSFFFALAGAIWCQRIFSFSISFSPFQGSNECSAKQSTLAQSNEAERKIQLMSITGENSNAIRLEY